MCADLTLMFPLPFHSLERGRETLTQRRQTHKAVICKIITKSNIVLPRDQELIIDGKAFGAVEQNSGTLYDI